MQNLELLQDFTQISIVIAMSMTNYNSIQSLSTEARQKLTAIDPATLAQASRIPGVSPSDVNVLLVLMGR